MAAATDLDRFVDFYAAAREKLLTTPNELISMASSRQTYLFGRLMKKMTKEKLVQAGKVITDFVQLAYTSSFRMFKFTDSFSYTGTNSLTQLSIPWRHAMTDTVINEAEIDFQGSDEKTTFKKVMLGKEAERELSWFEGMDDVLAATPNNATMESSTALGVTAGDFLSLRCFITDDGLEPSSTNGGVTNSTDFTTIMGVDPSTYPNFANQYTIFDNASNATRRAEAGGVLNAFDEMYLRINWQTPDNFEQYMQDTALNQLMILCNRSSYKLYASLVRQSNNVLTPKNDPGWAIGNIAYSNIPLKYWSKLDTVDDDGTPDAQDGVGKIGFRWRFVNGNWIYPIFHSKHYRRLQTKDGGAAQPFSKVLIENTSGNFWCMNRREQGIVRAAKSGETVV